MGAKRWTSQEDEILREIWHSKETMSQQIHRLPWRTIEGSKARAESLGLGSRYVAWTNEEDRILTEIWSMGTSLKSQMHRLPNRSWKAAIDRARVIGLKARPAKQFVSKYSWVEDVVIAELAKGTPLSAHLIADRTPASYQRAIQILRRGHGSKYRIADWERRNVTGTGSWTAIWALGSEPDAPRPANKSREAQSRDYRQKKRIAAGRFNPFLAAAGLVTPPSSGCGRVYQQPMEIDDWGQSRKEAA